MTRMATVPNGIGTEPTSQRPAQAHLRCVLTCALITSACTVAGLGLALSTLPPLQTPSQVATAYIEARLDQDWTTTRELVCGPALKANGFHAYTDEMTHLDESFPLPPDVNVALGTARVERGLTRPLISISVTLTSDAAGFKGWTQGGYLALVEEDGNLRVCSESASLGL
jgi:hypothetical protein